MEKQILYLSGNDKTIALWVYEIVPGDNDTPVKNPLDLTTCDKIEVNFVHIQGKRYAIQYAPAQDEDNKLILTAPYTLPAGDYNVELKVVLDSVHLRSYELSAIDIKYSNGEVATSFEKESGEEDCDLSIELQVVPSASGNPITLYELWKQQPGNEDGTFYEFMTIYMAALVEPAAQELLSGKVDKEAGKGLSTYDFDQYYKGTVDSLILTTAALAKEIEELKKKL